MVDQDQWDRFKRHCCSADDIGLRVDVSHMRFGDEFLSSMESRMQGAFAEMAALESGAIANSDEGRMVGHYWLRAHQLAPTTEIAGAIRIGLEDIRAFASSVHSGETATADGKKFTHLLSVGIGGSALGPQFVADALGGPGDKIAASFIDNTDPDGIDRTLDQLGERLASTLVLVISKSGGTIETQNGMLEVKRRFEQKGLTFQRHAIAITGADSKLDRIAQSDGWLKRFEMWDWVGGRTSELSAVGLVPAALQGYDIDGMLAGASACDQVTRVAETGRNPAALLALMWYYAGQGRGAKDMVVLPYKDRLAMFGKYLQQLVMESLGKKTDRDGKTVHQGLTVYGNKGSTDQHAYVQQLRDGLNGFFVTFVEVLRDRDGESMFVQPGFTAGDYLHGFLQGTRRALDDAGRESITITISEISPWSIGVLIALFERAVGLYASLININAYHQPGVEAGKKAAGQVIDVQSRLTVAMQADPSGRHTAEEWASIIDADGESETVFGILEHLAANSDRSVARVAGPGLFDTRYGIR